MNKVTLLGRIATDLDFKKTKNGMSVLKFKLAVNRKGKEKKTDFVPIKMLGQQADYTNTYARKGLKVLINGSILFDSYTNPEDVKVYYTEVLTDVYEGIILLERSDKDQKEKEKENEYGNDLLDDVTEVEYDPDEIPF